MRGNCAEPALSENGGAPPRRRYARPRSGVSAERRHLPFPFCPHITLAISACRAGRDGERKCETCGLERRATGWLDDPFHLHFRELLLHAAARQDLFCPVYVLMPDHLHVVWMGMRVGSDQRLANRFLRKHLAAEFARRSSTGMEFELQKQSHDRVLREEDRRRGAFERACFYVLDNPRRKGLVKHPRENPASARR